MPRFTENQRRHAIGMIPSGLAQNIVSRHFGVLPKYLFKKLNTQ
jgi:hypothetical protein